mgnify:CR=1 FL=1
MEEQKKISQAEMKVMEKLWERREMLTISDIVAALQEDGEEWSHQAIASFLKRLEDKGYLSSTKKSYKRSYFPLISREEYNRQEAEKFVNQKFGGSLKKFLAAFSGNKSLSKDKIDELKEWLKEFDD